MSKAYVGIDVGLNGAAVALDEYGELLGAIALPHIKEVPCYRKDKTRSVLDVSALNLWLEAFEDIEVIAAEESPSYGMGVTSAYTSGYNNGCLASLCQSWFGESKGFYTVAPKVWQMALYGDIIDASDEGWSKERSVRLAIMQHGDLPFFEKPKKTADGFADACHIAEWGRRLAVGFEE